MDLFDGYDSYDESTPIASIQKEHMQFADSCPSSSDSDDETTLLKHHNFSLENNDPVILSNKIKDQLLVISKKDREISNKHRNIEIATIDSMQYVTFLGIFSVFGYTLRSNIIVLYMRSFMNSETNYANMVLISIILYLSCIISGLNSILWSRFGNYWRFDTLLVLSIFMDIALFSVEASSWNFTMLALAYSFSGQPIQALANGYVNKMLPATQSQQQISMFYKLGVISYVLGPALAGMKFFCFYVFGLLWFQMCCVSFCCFVVFFVFFFCFFT